MSTSSDSVAIVAVIDRSGSMQNLAPEVISGYNKFLAEQKEVAGRADVTLILFDNRVTVMESGLNIADAAPLNDVRYQPSGMTALNDAIGTALDSLFKRNPEKAIIQIITDGAENASKEYNVIQVRKMVDKAKAKGWQVEFMSAGLDGQQDAALYGLKNTAFAATSGGVSSTMNYMSSTVRSYRGS